MLFIRLAGPGCAVLVCRTFLYRRGYLPQEVEPGCYPFPKRQVPVIGEKTFLERSFELKGATQLTLSPVDIGLPYIPEPLLPNRPQPKKSDLESAARKRTLVVPLVEIHSPTEDTHAPVRRLIIAQHYDIFDALFGYPHFFVPQTKFNICYAVEETTGAHDCYEVQPVYTGNFVSPKFAMTRPLIGLSDAPSGHLWTLVMSCPDEPIREKDDSSSPNEYLHWIVSNLPSGSNSEDVFGDEIVPYLPPLPYAGTGYHRYVFILYRQNHGAVDLRELKLGVSNGEFLSQRHFNTLDFYRRFESELTPTGLAFFQSSWDNSVRSYYREVLHAPEPIFELEWPDPSVPPQERYPVADSWNKPRRHPHGIPLVRERYGAHTNVSFDVYLDRYRDRKELAEELIRERLKTEGNPLDIYEPSRVRVKYPSAVRMPPGRPSWWMKQEEKRRLRLGRWRYLEGHDD